MLLGIPMENASFGDHRNMEKTWFHFYSGRGKKKEPHSKNHNSSEVTAGREPVKKTKFEPKRGFCSVIESQYQIPASKLLHTLVGCDNSELRLWNNMFFRGTAVDSRILVLRTTQWINTGCGHVRDMVDF